MNTVLNWLKENWWLVGVISALLGVQFVTPKKINIGEIIYNILYYVLSPIRFLICGKEIKKAKERGDKIIEAIEYGQQLDKQFLTDREVLYSLKALHQNDMLKVDNTNKLVLAMARNTILKICDDYLEQGEIPYLSLEVLNKLFDEYEAQGGNGGVKVKVTDVNKLPRV